MGLENGLLADTSKLQEHAVELHDAARLARQLQQQAETAARLAQSAGYCNYQGIAEKARKLTEYLSRMEQKVSEMSVELDAFSRSVDHMMENSANDAAQQFRLFSSI